MKTDLENAGKSAVRCSFWKTSMQIVVESKKRGSQLKGFETGGAAGEAAEFRRGSGGMQGGEEKSESGWVWVKRLLLDR